MVIPLPFCLGAVVGAALAWLPKSRLSLMEFMRIALVFGVIGMTLGAFVAAVWLQDKSIVRAAKAAHNVGLYVDAPTVSAGPATQATLVPAHLGRYCVDGRAITQKRLDDNGTLWDSATDATCSDKSVMYFIGGKTDRGRMVPTTP